MKIGILTDAHLFHKNTNINLYRDTLIELQENTDIIVDCGDTVDKSILTADQSNQLLQIYNNIRKPLYVVRGNHDTDNNNSVLSLLELQNNITVCNDVYYEKTNNLLFVPYIDNKKELLNKLNSLSLQKSCDYAFSHLNMTKRFYSTYSFDNCDFLYLYANTWFNGHIHMPEDYNTVKGTIYNIGSFSSLTFSDSHIPCVYILDTETEENMTKFFSFFQKRSPEFPGFSFGRVSTCSPAV